MDSPLTDLTLEIDRRRSGWAERALSAGATLLDAAGRPAMAAHLRAELARAPHLATLTRYLRLTERPGEAPEHPEAMQGGDAARRRVTQSALPSRLRQAWRLPEHYSLSSHHLLAGQSVVAIDAEASPAGFDSRYFLCRFSLADGAELWRRPLPGSPADSLVLVGEQILCPLSDGRLAWFDLAAGMLLSLSTPEPDSGTPAPPVVADDILVVGGQAQPLRAWRASTGRPLWQCRDVNAHISAAPAIAEGRLLVPSLDGRLLCLSLESGAELWRAELDHEQAAEVAIDGDRVFVGTGIGPLFAFDLESGAKLWRSRHTGYSELGVCGGTLVASYRARARVGFAVENGQDQWQSSQAPSAEWMLPPLICAGRLLCVTTGGALVVRELETGSELARQKVGSGRFAQPWLSPCGRLLLPAFTGGLLCLEPAE